MADSPQHFFLRAAVLEPTEGLPPLPEDPQGRLVRWARVARPGLAHYFEAKLNIDERWMDERIALFNRLVRRGFQPQILADHDTKSIPEGDVLSFVKHQGADGLEMLAALAWCDELAEHVVSKRIKYVSLGLKTIQEVETGEWLRLAPVEVSRVPVPHFPTAEILAKGVVMEDATPTTEPSVADQLAEILARLDNFDGRLSQLEQGNDDATAEDAEPEETKEVSEDSEEPTAMAASIAQLKSELASTKAEVATERRNREWLEFSQAYPAGGTFTLDAKAKAWLFAAALATPGGFDDFDATFAEPVEETTVEPSDVSAGVVVREDEPVWAKRLAGSHANPPQATMTMTVAQVEAQAKAEEKPYKDVYSALRLAGYAVISDEEADR